MVGTFAGTTVNAIGADPVGGALSPVTCQILADITGRRVETVASPQNVGSVGAAAVMGVGLGLMKDLSEAGRFIPVTAAYEPKAADKAVYDRQFEAFKMLYKANSKCFTLLNHIHAS